MSQKSEDDREKKGCSHFLSHSAEQNGFRWHRVKIDGEKTSVMWTWSMVDVDQRRDYSSERFPQLL